MHQPRIIALAVLALPLSSLADRAPDQLNEATLVELQQQMARGRLTSIELTRYYLQRIVEIDQKGPDLNSFIELNPDALGMAQVADAERRHGIVRGPLHGIPVVLKDNIDTGDRMQTTAGSFALAGRPALQDSTVAAKLRAGGAVILGKTNLSEWANFRGFFQSSAWSGRGGLTKNPFVLDRNPSGSSSGSAVAVSANLTAVALGTETNGSLVSPAQVNGIVAIKPTVGLTSRAGVVPLSHTQDCVGPLARTVADAAATLSVIQSTSFDGRDPATAGVPIGWRGRSRPALPTDYTQFLDGDGLRGARLGVTRQGVDNGRPEVVAAWDAAVATMQAAGATIVDLDAAGASFPFPDGGFLTLLYDFKVDAAAYFATRVGVPVAGGTLHDVRAFDQAHADAEMPFFGQEIFDIEEDIDVSSPDAPQPDFDGLTYNQALDGSAAFGANVDRILADNALDAIVAPTGDLAWATDLYYTDRFTFGSSYIAAIGGYPNVQVPASTVFGLPFGVSFMGTAFSEPTLIKLASGFEAATLARVEPTFSPTLLPDHTKGVPLLPKHRGLRRPSAKHHI